MTVLLYAKHELTLNLKRFRQTDNDQYNSHTAQSTLEFYIIINSM